MQSMLTSDSQQSTSAGITGVSRHAGQAWTLDSDPGLQSWPRFWLQSLCLFLPLENTGINKRFQGCCEVKCVHMHTMFGREAGTG